MKFSSAVRYRTAENCAICNRSATIGRVVPLYKEYLPFICDECYCTYFHSIKSVESNALVKYRPANVHRDRYRMKHIFTAEQLIEFLIWPYIGLGLWLLCQLIYMTFPSGIIGSHPAFMRVVMAVYCTVTLKGIIDALILFVRGALCGMSRDRLLLAGCKIVFYLLCFPTALLYGVL